MRFLTAILFLFISNALLAQNLTTWGTEFYIPNSDGYLIVETDAATTVTIEDLATGFVMNYSYAANSSNMVNMDNSSIYNSIEPYYSFLAIENSIKVTSSDPINLRYSFGSHTGGGSSMILPKSKLGTSYTLSTHYLKHLETWLITSFMTMIFVTATEDNTEVELTLTHPTENGFPVNTPFTLTLDEGEVQVIRGFFCNFDSPLTGCYSGSGQFVTNDFSGSKIESKSSCSPVSVHYYTGGYFNDVDTYGIGACCSDRVMEQFLPHKYWGNEYYAVPEQHVVHGNIFKIFSRFDNNDIFINGFPVATLNANETLDTLLLDPAYIKTSKQSLIGQYYLSAQSASHDTPGATDPEVTFVLPIEYRSSVGNFGFPTSLYNGLDPEQWISIVTEKSNVGNIIFDGSPISASEFTPFSSISPFSWAYLPLTAVDHEIHAASGSFQATVMGHALYASRTSYLGIDTFQEQSDETLSAEIICYTDQPVTLYSPEPGTDVVWSTGEAGDSILVFDPGLYTVEATDSCGEIEFSQSYLVTYDCDPQIAPEFLGLGIPCDFDKSVIPNVFTPNQDNINDSFEFEVAECIEEFQFTILNRWGNSVFSTDDHSVNWDGVVQGDKAADGTYFWVLKGLDHEESEIKLSGFLTLIK